MKRTILLPLLLAIVFSCKNTPAPPPADVPEKTAEVTSLFGKKLYPPPPDSAQIKKWEMARAEYEAAPDDPDKLIWYGRRTAYLGRYQEAIALFAEGIKKHPEDARMRRHRGHRYISTRQFEAAIEDLEMASKMIEGTKNEIEPDGIPNARNTPVSTLHGNIWYHLGLAYYLRHDWENALRAYRQCRAVSTNADNLVSSGHWLYMILRRMGREAEAAEALEPITANMDIVENTAYHQLCLFYKGEMTKEDLQPNGSAGSNDAVAYGLANWQFYNGEKEAARQSMEVILENGSWNAFGYIAAEADLFSAF